MYGSVSTRGKLTHASSKTDPIRLARVPQTTNPGMIPHWITCASIEIWSMKLMDDINRAQSGLRGSDDKVLDIEGVGGVISCKFNACVGFIGRSGGVASPFLLFSGAAGRTHKYPS